MANDKTPPMLLAFPHLYTPQTNDRGEPRYSLCGILTEEALEDGAYQLLRQNIMAAAREKWGDKAEGMFRSGQLRNPIRDAAERSKYQGFTAGRKFINLVTKNPPGVVDKHLLKAMPEDVYPGALVCASYRAFPYDTNGNRGVSLGLQNVMILDTSLPRIDGKLAADADFADMAETPPASGGAGGAGDENDMPFYASRIRRGCALWRRRPGRLVAA